MANNKGRYYGNRKGATIPIMARVAIETYQNLLEISEKTEMCLNQILVMLVEHGLSHAAIEECTAYRMRFDDEHADTVVPDQKGA